MAAISLQRSLTFHTAIPSQMKEQIVFNLDAQYIKVVAADREREAQKMRLVRQTKQARSEGKDPRRTPVAHQGP